MALGLSALASAQEGHDHGAAPHGGSVVKTQRHQFEVVVRKDGLNLYPIGQNGGPVDASRLTGTVTFTLPGVSKPFNYRLRPAVPTAGRTPDSLGLVVDLTRVPTTGSKVTFQIAGLPDPAEPTAAFTVPFTLAEALAITFIKAMQSDQKAIAAQKVCKISGEELGSMGRPIKAMRGDASTFLCCAECEKKLLADPDKYLAAALTAAKATRADQGAIAAQKTCPVSGEDLGSMGTPIKVMRGDRSIFLCCPQCLKKVEADPDTFLRTAPRTSAKEKHRPAD